VLIFKKGRENPDDILFIDASQGFEKVGNQNKLRPGHIERIVTTYRQRQSHEKFSHVADLSQVQENEFNLSIPRYVDTFDEEEQIDLDAVVAGLAMMAQKESEADAVIAECCKQLGLPFPAGHNSSLLENYKKGVMQQLFTQTLRFQDDHGHDFPEWEEKPLGSVATLINGRAYKQNELLSEGPYPVLRVGNFFSNPEWYYSDLELPQDKYCDTGDLLYAWSASFGPRIWKGGKVIYHYHIWKVLPSTKVDKNYLFHFMDWDTERIKRAQSSGAVMLHVTKQSMEERPMPVPSLPEQTKIAGFLSAMDGKIAAVGEQMRQTQAWKKGLLQQMFV